MNIYTIIAIPVVLNAVITFIYMQLVLATFHIHWLPEVLLTKLHQNN